MQYDWRRRPAYYCPLTLKTVNDHRTERWLLPDGVNELMPDEAWRVESLRRLIMDSCHQWGYELVMPPLIEYLDSLLTGTGETLDLNTFKFIDQHNGRMLGIRADMTPQVARIDAHSLFRDQPNRLFYTGSVLRARSDGAGSSRTPLQFGAEVFGHSGPESDIEIIQLMLNNVLLADLPMSDLLLDVGHVGVFRSLVSEAGIPPSDQEKLFQSMLRGSKPELAEYLDSANVESQIRTKILALASLSGSSEVVLEQARNILQDSGGSVNAALDNLQTVVDAIRTSHPALRIHIDLAELRGYSYHTGMLFTLYDGNGAELTRGGRYDAIGEAFGRARPATGFSGDLVKLALARKIGEDVSARAHSGIWVDEDASPALWQQISSLRASGERVVVNFAGADMDAAANRCDRQLVEQDGTWVVEPLL